MSTYVRIERDGPIARVVLDRADKGHAWLAEMWLEARRLIQEAGQDEGVRVILLDSEGDRVFSGGADLVQLGSIVQSREETSDLLNRIEGVMAAIETAPQPVIAVISGAAIGAGLEIAAASDLRIASETATFGIPAARIGIVVTRTDVARLVRVAGAARAWDLLLTGRLLTAREAQAAGMVSEVVPSVELRERAREFALAIAQLSPRSLQVMKRHLLEVSPSSMWDGGSFHASLDALTSADFIARLTSRAEERSQPSGTSRTSSPAE